jgi:hypothetical protein
VIDNPAFRELFTSLLGEGWAGSPSEEVVVKVMLEGEPRRYASGRTVELRATKQDSSVVFNRRMPIGIMSNDGHYFAMFVLYGTGCAALHLPTQVLGQSPVLVVEKDIPFRCGE